MTTVSDRGFREQVGLMLIDQRIDDHIQIAFHEFIQPVHGQIDTMIRHPALRKIICPDPLRTVAGTDQIATVLSGSGGLVQASPASLCGGPCL